jgi:hypothetical protein
MQQEVLQALLGAETLTGGEDCRCAMFRKHSSSCFASQYILMFTSVIRATWILIYARMHVLLNRGGAKGAAGVADAAVSKAASSASSEQQSSSTASTLKPSARITMISFDLDDTIWPTREVITRANDALAAHLEEHYPAIGSVPDAMRAVWAERRAADPNLHPSPIHLTGKSSLCLLSQ